MIDVRYRRLDLEDMGFEDLHWAYAYWQERRGEHAMPAWADIDLNVFPPDMLPRVCVVDVTPPAVDFRYRFWGTAITAMHHYDLTQRSVRKLTPPEYASCIWKQYMEVFERREPAAFITEVPLERGLTSYYAVVRMPLSQRGRSVDQILSAEAYGDQAGELRKRFEDLWSAQS